MDIIFVRDLRVETVIGVDEWERHVRQTVALDLEFGAGIQKAAATDAIEDTLNYHAIASRAREHVEQSQCRLVESLAEQVAELLMREFGIAWLRLTLTKPGAVRGSKGVGVTIERGSRGARD